MPEVSKHSPEFMSITTNGFLAADLIGGCDGSPRLVHEMRRLEEKYLSLGGKNFTQQTVHGSGIQLNGRALYVLPQGSYPVMVKGGGNEKFINNGPYSGYPATFEELYFDNPRNRQNPRIWGALSFEAGIRELIMACVHLRASNAQSVEAAIVQGCTVPLGVILMPDLTEYLQGLQGDRHRVLYTN